MSSLLEAAKPLVLAWATGQTLALNASDQELLAAWIAMGVITSEFFDASMVAVPDVDRLHLWLSRRAPPGWRIWIGHYQRGDWRPYRLHRALEIADVDPSEAAAAGGPVRPNTQSTTLVFGQLFVHAVSSVFQEVVDRLRFKPALAGLLVPLQPSLGEPIQWLPSHTLSDRDADNLAGSLLDIDAEALA